MEPREERGVFDIVHPTEGFFEHFAPGSLDGVERDPFEFLKIEFDAIEDAVAIHNGVPQGLSSAIFTDSMRTAETFLSVAGSDCGIANVNIDLTAHTHHAPESSGSQCYNCHMPHTTWGLLGAMRAHRIDSPSVAVSVSTGRPNACNLCHLDTSLGDASDRLTAWYGQPAVELTVEERDIAASILWLIKGNGLQRAILAWHMSWKPALAASGDTWQAAYLSQVLNDPYPAVRHAAGRSLHALPGFDAFAYDYTDASHIHDAAAVLARQRWLALFPSLGTRPSLLLADGAIDWNLVAALQALRDNARIEVDE